VKLRQSGTRVALITAGVFGWMASMGAAVAGASPTRAAAHTVGGARVQLVGHVAPATGASGALLGADIMAAVVGTLALGAFAFLVVTFVTHRRSPAA
jgi:hypothetical protein